MTAVGHILGKHYDDFRYVEYSRYSLPIVKCAGAAYSGFNMGAGENALFEIFSTIYAAGKGSLLVMDEIELGLHAEAQRKFVDALKDICLEMHTQVICTTHSTEIFDCLPGDARFYVESVSKKTRVTQGISSEFAFAKLSSRTGLEIDVYVEDDVAKTVLQAALPASIRSRATFTIIGSATALARQLAALYVRGETKPVVAVFDGDQRTKESENLEHARKMTENPKSDFNDWFKSHVTYLPGNTWPEAWLLQKAIESLDSLSETVGTNPDELAEYIEYGQQAGKHNEFYEIADHLGLERHQCLQAFTFSVVTKFPEEFEDAAKVLQNSLDEN